MVIRLAGLLLLTLLAGIARGQPFLLPTANHALFEKNGEEKFFVGTVGKPWTTGTFGCVRSDGWQMHEGLDIRCLQRDKRGEPTDPVLATADGTVAYINSRPPSPITATTWSCVTWSKVWRFTPSMRICAKSGRTLRSARRSRQGSPSR